MELTPKLWPRSVATSFFDYTFQSLTVLSELPEAKYLPSGENVTKLTYKLCPRSVVTSFCDSTLQSLTVLSELPEAKYFPSDENATE
jgi:hypothetical protein